jgi:hypothetical protein
MEASASILSKISYLDVQAVGDRVVGLLPLWNGRTWTLWIPAADGLLEMHPLDATQAEYVASEAAGETDILLPFLDLLWQRCSWSDVVPSLTRIRDDLYNLGAALAKIDHFFEMRDTIGLGVGRFVCTELEYIFAVCRSLLDLVQEAVSTLWGRVRLIDSVADGKKGALPRSLRKVVVESERLRSSEEIREKFLTPAPLSEAYATIAPFFSNLRRFRDAVLHGGTSVDLVVSTERGFCVSPKRLPFRLFDIWRPEHAFNTEAYSLRPFVAHVVATTIDACDRIVAGLAQEIVFPAEIAPGYRVFLRGMHNAQLIRAKRLSDGEGDVWWSAAGVT